MSGLLASLKTPITHLRTNKRFTIRFHCDVYRYFHPRHAAPLADESPRRDFLRKNSKLFVGGLADWSLPILRYTAGCSDLDLNNEEYPRVDPRSV